MISVVDIHDQRSFRGPSELDNFSDGRFVSAVESVKQHGRSANIIVAPSAVWVLCLSGKAGPKIILGSVENNRRGRNHINMCYT